MEYDDAGNVLADYTQGIGIVRSRRDNREVYHHTDGLGSTRALTDTVGLVTDRYTYDAYGGVIDHQGTFGNSFQFAGEQRDSSTGLDYLRARYYDSSLGRFVSADAFSGSMNDPTSLHNYQYANSNPNRYTDPTGYFSMGDVLTTINVMAILGGVGGASFGTGYILAGAISGQDVGEMLGNFGTGFANGISGGMITQVYEMGSGTKIVPKHGALHNAGMVTGVAASILTGTRFIAWAQTAVGPLKWMGVAGAGGNALFDGWAFGSAARNTWDAAQDGWQWEDNVNLLGFIPFAMTGVSKFIAASRAVRNPGTTSANAVLKDSRTTNLTAGSKCFVAGTEVLTTEGMRNIEDIKVGDWVIADDPTTPGEIEARQVLDTFVRQTENLVDLYIDGEVISTTGEHPFWTPDRGWVEAKNLQVGSQLQTEDGRVIDVDRIEKREGDFTVYNFNVEGFHTYFISELGILVHNAGDLYLGDGIKVDSVKFHKDGGIKGKILKRAKREDYSYIKEVGKNPDVKIIDGMIHLVGSRNGPFTGRTFPTEIPSADFFD